MKNLGLYNEATSVPRKQDIDSVVASKQDKIAVSGVLERSADGTMTGLEKVEATEIDTVEAELVDLPDLSGKLDKPANDASATAGQVLTKTADGSEWKDASGGEPFIVTVTGMNDDGTCTVDKTAVEIKAAYDAGKYCYCLFRGVLIAPLIQVGVNESIVQAFFSATFDGGSQDILVTTMEDTTIASTAGHIYIAQSDVDDAMSDTSENPVQNKVVNAAIEAIKLSPSDTTPKAPGTAAAGSEETYARGDHVHPNEVFWATYGTTTFEEIKAAFDAGKQVFVYTASGVHSLCLITQTYCRFSLVYHSGDIKNPGIQVVTLSGNGDWSIAYTSLLTSGAADAKSRKVTLTTAGWNSSTKQQSVACSGVLADATAQLLIPTPVNTAADNPYDAAGIQMVAQGANSVTFYAETVPTEAIEVYVTMYPINYLG